VATRLLLLCLLCVAVAGLGLHLTEALARGLSEAGGELAREGHRREALDRLRREALEGVWAKQQVAEEVASGKLSVDEAVSLFRRLNRQKNEATAGLPCAFPYPEDDAALRAQVLLWMKNVAASPALPPAAGL
jgi:hypothetical protein